MDALDTIRVFLAIDQKKSRLDLTKELAMGEGVLRSDLLSLITIPLPITLPYYKDKRLYALVIQNSSKEITYKDRDVAVRAGAEGALIVKYDNGCRLEFAPEYDFSALEKLSHMKNGDVVVVCFSDSKAVSQRACYRVCFEFHTQIQEMIA